MLLQCMQRAPSVWKRAAFVLSKPWVKLCTLTFIYLLIFFLKHFIMLDINFKEISYFFQICSVYPQSSKVIS